MKYWTLPLRALLSAMWIAHGLEKLGVKWPAALAGGTHSVSGMLGFMMDETPFALVKTIIGELMLPVASIIQIPTGLLEIAIGLALATGILLPWAAVVGALMQWFFWLGFFVVDWPFQYPLIIAAHLVLGARHWMPKIAKDQHTLLLLRLTLGLLWLYESGGHISWALIIGLALLTGLGSRLAAGVSMVMVLMAFANETWGSWPWAYYLVAMSNGALIIGERGEGVSVARYLPERLRKWAA